MNPGRRTLAAADRSARPGSQGAGRHDPAQQLAHAKEKTVKQTILMTIAVATALVAGGAVRAASTTTVPVADWGALNLVGGTYPTNDLVYAFVVAPDQPLSIRATFVPSGYEPGAYQPGYISPGWISVQRSCAPNTCYDGNVIFDMGKYYSSAFSPSDTMILIGGPGRGVDEGVDYVPGATYTTTMTWNRAASTIDITVAGLGLNYARTVASYGGTITGLVFHGPTDTHMSSLFGDVSVTTQAVPEPGTWLLLAAGLGAVGFKARRQATGATRAAGQA
jgi:hypothetical protein